MMTGMLYKLMVGVAAFLIGLSVVSIKQGSPPMSLCQLDANPELYQSKTVRFRAIVERRRAVGLEKSDLVFAYSFCPGSDQRASVTVDLDASDMAKIPLTEMRDPPSAEVDHFHLAVAVIEGELDPFFQRGCFGPKYLISNARVERVFATQNFDDYPHALEWIKSNSY